MSYPATLSDVDLVFGNDIQRPSRGPSNLSRFSVDRRYQEWHGVAPYPTTGLTYHVYDTNSSVTTIDAERQTREGFVFAGGVADSSSASGETASFADLTWDVQRLLLESLIHYFSGNGLSWDFDQRGKITIDTARSAKALLRHLDVTAGLPQIAPDGEGGLTMLWKNPGRTILLNIDNGFLHAVIDPGAAHAAYYDNLPFDGESVPAEIMAIVPTR